MSLSFQDQAYSKDERDRRQHPEPLLPGTVNGDSGFLLLAMVPLLLWALVCPALS